MTQHRSNNSSSISPQVSPLLGRLNSYLAMSSSGAGTHSTSAGDGDGGGSGSSPSDRSAVTPSALASALFSTPPRAAVMQVDDQGTPSSQPATRGGAAPLALAPVSRPSPQSAVSKKKKKGARAVGPDKNGRGLRQFSMRVCEKVENKGTTTYNEVADELVAEFSNLSTNIDSPDGDNTSALQYDEKNIRRRVYDALNVLRAMEIISNDKKEIQWRGLPKTSMNGIEELKTKVTGLKDRIEKKNALLKDLEEQYVCLHNLVQQNKQLYGSGDEPSSRLAVPFFLATTEPQADLVVEWSEDSKLVHLDFDTTPFQLHDEISVMKAMGLCGNKETDCNEAPVANGGECSSTPSNYWHQSLQPPEPREVWVPNSHPTPGILKEHAKHGHKE